MNTIPTLTDRDLFSKLDTYIKNGTHNFDKQKRNYYRDTVDDTMYNKRSTICSITKNLNIIQEKYP